MEVSMSWRQVCLRDEYVLKTSMFWRQVCLKASMSGRSWRRVCLGGLGDEYVLEVCV